MSSSNRIGSRKLFLLLTAAALLAVKVLLEILGQYRWYFPANFEQSAFLIGREAFFHGVYWWAFYVHILISPITAMLAGWLLFSGAKGRFLTGHRRLGKLQVLLVLGLVAPSGLVMSYWAFTGPIAGWGFALLSLGTGFTAVMTAYHARGGRIRRHRVWAVRCLLLLASPFILRIVSGVFIVTGWESEWTYRLTAWLSWLGPLTIYETIRLYPNVASI